MITVSILHNVGGDFLRGYAYPQPLVRVFDYEVAGPLDLMILENAFERFNVGEDELALAYRARKLRSLSVGDVIVLDGCIPYACEAVGWSPLGGRLNVLKGAEAEAAIRQRYSFRPDDELTVTVPLPEADGDQR